MNRGEAVLGAEDGSNCLCSVNVPAHRLSPLPLHAQPSAAPWQKLLGIIEKCIISVLFLFCDCVVTDFIAMYVLYWILFCTTISFSHIKSSWVTEGRKCEYAVLPKSGANTAGQQFRLGFSSESWSCVSNNTAPTQHEIVMDHALPWVLGLSLVDTELKNVMCRTR